MGLPAPYYDHEGITLYHADCRDVLPFLRLERAVLLTDGAAGRERGVMIRAISLTQPWATLVAIGAKQIETRSWATAYRGWLLIHAAKGFPADAQALCGTTPFLMALRRAGINSSTALPRGAIIAVANLHHVGRFWQDADLRTRIRGKEWPIEGDELAFGDYTPGRYGFVLTNIHPIPEPVLCRGALSLWVPPPEALARVQEQLPWLR